jgi:uncharacterized protein (DUF2147 family)
MPIHTHFAKTSLIAAGLLWSASAQAATDPTGIWFDHNGRGAVEIKQCVSGSGLCGHVVNVKDPANASRCGLQILGEVTPNGGGWIYSPERKRKYDVELKRLSDDKLRVVGNAGSRFFSRTFTWNRAPDDIARCSETTAAAPAKDTTAEAKPAVTNAAPAAAPVTTGAASGAAALVANTSAKTTGAVSPTTKEVTAASTIAPAPAATSKPAAATTTTAAAPTPVAGATETSSDTGSKRKCKYKIPYIGRTVSVPCRD